MPRRTWEQEEAELAEAATWDAEQGFEQPGNPAGRAIVSVPFARSDFTTVVQAAIEKAAAVGSGRD